MTDHDSFLLRLMTLAVLLGYAGAVLAQVVPAASHGAEVVRSAESDVPESAHAGWSLSDGTTAADDSLSGLSFLNSPAVAYRMNRRFSFDATLPYYLYLNAVKTGKEGNAKLAGHFGVLGDAACAAHASFALGSFDELVTMSLSAPTGDEHLGVGTGHFGYNVNNHVERNFGLFTPDVEAGLGNASSLLRRRASKAYTSSGMLLFLQAGGSVALPAAVTVDVEAYEQLPIGAQTVYSRASRKKGAVLTQTSDGEDNGLTFELDAPPMRRLLLTASFSHSLRLRDTTASVTLEWLLLVPGAR